MPFSMQVLRCRTQPLPEAATKALFEDLLHGLAACHARGILHRARRPGLCQKCLFPHSAKLRT
jgi:serine/threonine protein kinase